MDIQDKIARDEYEVMKAKLSQMVGGDPQKLEILLNTKLMRWLKGKNQWRYKHTFATGKRAGQTHEFVYNDRIKRDVRTAKILLPKEIEKLHAAQIITDEERVNFEAMLKSPDDENILMAELSINELRKKRLAKEARKKSKSTMKTVQEIFAQDMAQFRHDIQGFVEGFFEEHKEVRPVVFVLERSEGKTKFGVIAGIGQLFTNDEGKEQAAEILREFSKQHKVIAIATAFEGWMRVVPIQDKDKVLDENGNYRKDTARPSEAPDRIEVLMVGFETHNQESKIFYKINREGAEPRLEIIENMNWSEKDGKCKGRFDDLLSENYTAMAESLRESIENSIN